MKKLLLEPSKVQSLLDEGFLRFICDPKDLEAFWANLLKDFPNHPAAKHPAAAFPLSVYGRLSLFEEAKP